MKKAYVLMKMHMDLTWRHAQQQHQKIDGKIHRPYADIEEEQLRQILHFAEDLDMKSYVEQLYPIKRFFERNPDLKERFIKQVKNGMIDVGGGGISIIDVNLISGESILRNMYYAQRYLESTFDKQMSFYDTTDVFGLSAQIPQIARHAGVRANAGGNRNMKDPKTFWRGIDGTCIVMGEVRDEWRVDLPEGALGVNWGYEPCPACNGEGCIECEETGSRRHPEANWVPRMQGRIETQVKRFAEEGKEVGFLSFNTEEAPYQDFLVDMIYDICAKYDIVAKAITPQEYYDIQFEEAYKRLETGEIPEDMIDPRTEGFPVMCGCYTSRIKIKQIHRKAEYGLLGAEKLAACVCEAEEYPAKKIEALWEKLQLVQFHDSLPGTLADTAYDETMRFARDVKLGAAQIAAEAMRDLEKKVNIEEKSGKTPFLLFSPNGAVADELGKMPIEIVLKSVFAKAVHIYDVDGNELPVLEITPLQGNPYRSKVTFLGEVPPMGYSVFYYELYEAEELAKEQEQDAEAAQGQAQEAKVSEVHGDDVATRSASEAIVDKSQLEGTYTYVSRVAEDFIENEFYRVDATGIFDKQADKYVTKTAPGTLYLNDDHGNVWMRWSQGEGPGEYLVPTLKAVEKGAHHQVMILEHAYENEERKVKQLSWQTKITLYKGNRMVHIKTELDWEGSDAHLYVDVVPEFETNDKGIYEIPYAMIERDKPHMQKDRQGYHDEWPCHNWFGAQNGSDNLFIINKGLHGCRIIDNHMQLSLLRSPTEIWGCCIETGGAVETGHHTFEYAIASCKDGLEALNPSALGMRYNEPLFFTPARAKYGELPPKGSFIKNEAKNVLVTAVKLDDNGDRVIRAYEAYGKLHTEDSFGKALTPSDGLESPIGAPQERTTYHKFEIRTFIDKK